MRFTVFTPAYNRAYSLFRLFDSLKKQTFQDFEWIIVDDGSTDNTQEIIQEILSCDHSFKIISLKTENGGKHRAVNLGVKQAQGELFFIVDSDDYLPEKSLETFDHVEKSISAEQKKDFAGICGQRYYIKENSAIGTTFCDKKYLDITTIERGKYNITGDKSEVIYTNIFQKYPFPEIPGENFCTESIVWDRIAHDGFKFRFFNGDVYRCDYLTDGLTKKGMKLYAANPEQWSLSIVQSKKFKKDDFYTLTIHYYTFFIWQQHNLSFKKIAEMLELNRFCLLLIILVQKIMNFVRLILGRKLLKKD